MAQLDSRLKSSASNSPVPSNPFAKHPVPTRKKRLHQRLLRFVSFAAVCLLSGSAGLVAALTVPLPKGILLNDRGPKSLSELIEYGFQYRVARPVNILVMGIDRVPGAQPGTPEIFSGRSDTMLLLRVDPTDDSVSLLSIPRDTQVEIDGVGVTKINDANVRGGSKLAAKTVSETLNGVAIDRYVRVSTEAFRELVDLIGGVEVYVPEPMSYTDNTQKLKINLSAGRQVLTGDQAEQFARFRQDAYGDIGRVQRQQALLRALRQKLTNPMLLPRVPSIIAEMQKYVDTNLSPEEVLALVGGLRRLSQGDFKMVMLPGRFSQPGEFAASYWITNEAGRDRVMKQYFKIDPSSIADGSTPRTADSLRIAVQNASSNPHAAADFRQHLLSLGFTNVFVSEDWKDTQRKTQIVVQQGDLDGAQELQGRLGFGEVRADSTGDLDSDITIRLGNDWQPK